MQICCACQKTKQIEGFKRDKRRPRGLASICKECSKAKCKEWREGHKPERHYKSWLHIADKKERKKAIQKDWAKNNREKVRCKERTQEARKQNAEGSHTKADIDKILKLQNNRCAYCRCKLGKKYHVDHIRALSKGGSNWPKNLQALCSSCNLSKHDKDPIEYAQRIGKLI